MSIPLTTTYPRKPAKTSDLKLEKEKPRGTRGDFQAKFRRESLPEVFELHGGYGSVSLMKPTEVLPNLQRGAKVLFVRLRSLGDTILSTPLYAALKAWRPDLQVSVLVEKPSDEVLLHNPDLHQVLSIPAERENSLALLLARSKALAVVRRERFDCCINLHGGSTSGLFVWLSDAKHRVGLRQFREPFFYNVRIELSSSGGAAPKKHTVQYQMEWLCCLGFPGNDIPPLRVFPDPAIQAQVDDKLILVGIMPDTPYCVIQPASKFHTKEWTPQGFAEVSDYLQTQYGYSCVLTSGPGEESKLQEVAAHCRRKPAILQNVSVSELMWVLARARLFIGNDSGPTHLAAALKIPIVVLFGSSDSQVWHPWKALHEIVQNPFECNPCPGYRCLVYDQPKCILSITSGQVKSAIERVLSASSL